MNQVPLVLGRLRQRKLPELYGREIKDHLERRLEPFEAALWQPEVEVYELCLPSVGGLASARLLGFDHTRLTYRDHRLTDVQGNVVKGILN